MTAAVVLAAGLSRRMGRPKLVLEVAGRPIVRHAVEAVQRAGLDPVLVVTGPEPAPIQAALEGLPVRIVVNPAPEAGQSGSVRAGIAALPAEVETVLIALGDQPALDPGIIPALLAAHRAGGRPIVAPRYENGPGNPVLFDRAIFPELLALTGDQGARPVIARDPGRVEWVRFGTAMPPDVDTPADYEKIRSAVPPQSRGVD
ncbi:MAG TPA: nucleotidyltransferase family protein [Methylomirabilota bacterium]|nr:nucleotidyltransferase family protein [Methylomirabilota bacterium]